MAKAIDTCSRNVLYDYFMTFIDHCVYRYVKKADGMNDLELYSIEDLCWRSGINIVNTNSINTMV